MVLGRKGFFPIPPATYRTQASQLWRIKCRLHRLKPAAAREQLTPPVPQLLTTKEKVFNAVASISVAIHLYHVPLMVTFYWYPCSMHFPYSTHAQRVFTLKEYKLPYTQ
jgi:hypothetical protein